MIDIDHHYRQLNTVLLRSIVVSPIGLHKRAAIQAAREWVSRRKQLKLLVLLLDYLLGLAQFRKHAGVALDGRFWLA